jgi:hypothetical protein
MEQPINEPFTSEESQEIYQNFKTIINSRLDKLYNSKGSDGEQYAYSIAVKQMRKKQAEKLAEPTTEKPMEQGDKLKEMIQSALSKPLNEKKKSSSFTSQYDDKFTDGRKKLPDGLQKSILNKQGNLDEDLDLGHEDNEPHMLKADLYRIGKYAMELYKMVDQFEGEQEVDFPHWWQAKIIEAKNMLISAKHYLDFEIKEPQLDAMVDVASEEGAINDKPMMENIDEDTEEKRGHYVTIKSKDGTQKVTIKNLPNHVNKTYKGALSSIEDLKGIDGRKGKKYIYYVSDINGNPIDPPVDVASEEGAIDEEMTSEKSRKIGMPFKNKIKEAILAKLKK